MRKLKFKSRAALIEIEEVAERLSIPFRHVDVLKPRRIEHRIEIEVSDENLTAVRLAVADEVKTRPIGGWPKPEHVRGKDDFLALIRQA